ncbi:cysteine desulfurase [Qipengyuania flava]|nr:cysteine desulfurase [Qipengyuania flava]
MEKEDRIYLDHQATCPLDERVFEVMCQHLRGGAANPHSSEHSFGWEASKVVLEAQERVAALIGADADEIIFTSGATEANNLALRGSDFSQRSKLIVSTIEHKCVLEAARSLKADKAVEVASVKVDAQGEVRLDQLEELADERAAVVSVIGVHNEVGTVQPLGRISEIVRASGAALHFDMAQAPTAIDMAGVAELADTISLSAHKMYGPMGIGCLYVSRSHQSKLTPQIVGGGQQNGLRSGTVPVALAAGMGKAAEIVAAEAGERDKLRRLNAMLWTALQALPCEVELNGPSLDVRHPGNLNVSFSGNDSRDLIGALQPLVAVSSGSACTSGTEEPSYVIRELGHSLERAQSAIRFSIGRFTSEQDVISAVGAIERAVRQIQLAA